MDLVLISTKEAAETLAHLKVNVFDSQLLVEQSVLASIQANLKTHSKCMQTLSYIKKHQHTQSIQDIQDIWVWFER